MNKRRKYFITGGAGFIGSNFVRYLYEKEEDPIITVIDKLGYSGNYESLKEFESRDNFEFINGDICDTGAVKEGMKDANVVVNFAAEVSVDRSINNSQSFLKTDILGVQVLLENARTLPDLERFIQISTDEVYGQIMEGSFHETDELKPRNPYAASKVGGDRLAYSYFATYGMPIVITRASNTYGSHAYPEKVIPLFITNLIDNLKIPVFGTGQQVRDWLFVKDHCSGIYMAIEKGENGEVYNIGGSQECTNLELSFLILKVMNKDESFIKYVNDRPGHDFRYSLDTKKLQALGWKPEFDLQNGLARTIKWYSENENWWRPLKNKLDSRYTEGFWGEKKRN